MQFKIVAGVAPKANPQLESNVVALITRSPRTEHDFLNALAQIETIQHHLNHDIFEALAALWDEKDLAIIVERMRNAADVHSAMAKLRETNRELFAVFERAYPSKADGSILSDLARQTHESWLSGEKPKPGFVSYTQELHDLLVEFIEKGSITQKSSAGSVKMSLEDFENPKNKFKLTTANFAFQNTAQQKEFVARFQSITGKALSDKILINTVCGEYDELMAITPKTNPEIWATARPARLYSLQADSVSAVFAALKNKDIVLGLTQGSHNQKLQTLIEVARRVNLGWRLNNPWSGFGSYQLNKPFDLTAKEGGFTDGIGLEDIRKDAIIIRGVLEVLVLGVRNQNITFDSGMCNGELAELLDRAYDNGLEDVLASFTSRDSLAEAVITNVQQYIQADLDRIELRISG